MVGGRREEEEEEEDDRDYSQSKSNSANKSCQPSKQATYEPVKLNVNQAHAEPHNAAY